MRVRAPLGATLSFRRFPIVSPGSHSVKATAKRRTHYLFPPMLLCRKEGELAITPVAFIANRGNNRDMSTLVENRIGPSDLSAEQLKNLFQVVEGGGRPVLIGPKGEEIELPKALNDLFVAVIHAMKRREAVFLMHENEAFTTQAAANFLGISRQFLVRLLEDGKIPFHHAGTHRRVFFKDLVRYQHERSKSRKAKLDEMTEELVEAGVYDRFTPLEREETER